MSKFPALDFYRTLLFLAAVLLVIGSILLGLSLSQQQVYDNNRGIYVTQNNPAIFGVTLGTGIFLALGLLITEALIGVFVRIEDHLDRLQHLQERSMHLESAVNEDTVSPLEEKGISIKANSPNLMDIALRYPDTKPKYELIDVEYNETLIQVTDFQLEYLKSILIYGENDKTHFTRKLLEIIQRDISSLNKKAELLKRLSDRKTRQKATIVLSKADELQTLYDDFVETLEEDDSVEITWKTIQLSSQ